MNDILDKKLKINIHKDIFITTRTSNCLLDQGIFTIGDLINYNEKQLLTFPKLGKTGLSEIKVILYDLDLKLEVSNININQSSDKVNIKEDNKLNIEINQPSDQVNIKKNNILNDNLNIDMLKIWPLSARTQNCLRELNIRFVGDLVPYSKNDLLRSNNFGKKSLEELSAYFEKYSLAFGENVDPKWDDIREKLIKEDKLFYKEEITLENDLHNSEIGKRQYTISLSILEDPKKIQDTILEEKIIYFYKGDIAN